MVESWTCIRIYILGGIMEIDKLAYVQIARKLRVYTWCHMNIILPVIWTKYRMFKKVVMVENRELKIYGGTETEEVLDC